ncbi:hypothetical protein Tco_1210796 [Tanacetum coccineum]
MRHSLTYLLDLHLLFLFLIPFQRVLVGIIEVTYQAKEIKHLKAQIKKLKKKAKPIITHHKAWMKSVSMKQRLAGKKSLKKKWMQKESVSKQGRKSAKSEPTVYKDLTFDDLNDVDVNDAMDYMETNAYMQKGVSTDKPEVSTAKPKEVEVSTDKLDEGTAEPKDGTSDESTTPTTIFRDDETIAEYGYIKNHKKTVKNGQARTRESEEFKKKPKNQSRSQKSQTRSIQGVTESSTFSQQDQDNQDCIVMPIWKDASYFDDA